MCDRSKDFIFLVCKIFNSSFSTWFTHLILEVSSHSWLLWPTVWRGAVSRVRRKLRSDWEKWAWNNEDTLAVALHFVFCPHARHSTTKVTTSRCCGKITRRESICWQLAPREELSLLSCQIHSHQLRGYCQHSLLRKLCAKLRLTLCSRERTCLHVKVS